MEGYMHKSFFHSMLTFVKILAVLTVVGTIVSIPLLAFVSDGEKWYFNPSGFIAIIVGVISFVCLYYIMKGIAYIGLNSYKDEELPEINMEEIPEEEYDEIIKERLEK